MQYHSLLKRQFRRYLKDSDKICTNNEEFIGAVNDAYHQYDNDLQRLERSMELSSQELLQAVVKRKEIEQEILRKNQALAKLQLSTVRLLNTLDSKTIINIVLESAITMASAQGGFILQADDNNENLYIKAGLNVVCEGAGICQEYNEKKLAVDEKKIYQSFISGEILVTNEYNNAQRYLHNFSQATNVTLIAVPLLMRGQVMAIICLLYSAPLENGVQEIIEIIQQFGAAAAIALDNARLYTLAQVELLERRRVEEELRFVSSHDSLTGLFNRNYFEAQITKLRGNTTDIIGLIVCDLDGLKIINDTLGHAVGDEMLLMAAKIMTKVFGANGKVSRIGGDEFSILLLGAGNETLAGLCQNIQDFIKEYNDLPHPVYLSISTGYASNENNQQDITELFKEADKHMYREKMERAQKTRNAIVEKMMRGFEGGINIAEGRAHRIDSIEELAVIFPPKPMS